MTDLYVTKQRLRLYTLKHVTNFPGGIITVPGGIISVPRGFISRLVTSYSVICLSHSI